MSWSTIASHVQGTRNIYRRVGHQQDAIIRDDDDEMRRNGRRQGEDLKNALNEYPGRRYNRRKEVTTTKQLQRYH